MAEVYINDRGGHRVPIEVAIDSITNAPFLSEEQKRDILYNNAARFLRLTPEEIAKHHAVAR